MIIYRKWYALLRKAVFELEVVEAKNSISCRHIQKIGWYSILSEDGEARME